MPHGMMSCFHEIFLILEMCSIICKQMLIMLQYSLLIMSVDQLWVTDDGCYVDIPFVTFISVSDSLKTFTIQLIQVFVQKPRYYIIMVVHIFCMHEFQCKVSYVNN